MHIPSLPRSMLGHRLRFIALALSLVLPLLGQSADVPAPATSPAPTAASGATDYLLRPSDILQVKVFQEDDLTREVSVSQEYTVSLPLIGTVDLRKRTVRQAEELIRQLYDRDFLVNPQVTVIVLRYAERAVNVIGMVNSPQAVPFPPERGLTLLEAIARAGGFNRLADRSKVSITRTDDRGVATTLTVNADRLVNSNLWTLQVDDVIFVPEKFF